MDLQTLALLYRELSQKQPIFGGSQKVMVNDEPLVEFEGTVALLLVFEHLNPRDLCQAGKVCRQWYALASNNRLWKKAFIHHLNSWNRIYSHRNPHCMESQSYKQRYLRCHPNAERIQEKKNRSRWWPVINVAPPRIVMFGPGLETEGCSVIIRNILTDGNISNDTRFIVERLTPGILHGLGAGINVKFNHLAFDLQVLYTNIKKKRTSLSPVDRLSQNRMYDGQKMLLPDIQKLCASAAGFVYLVDSTYKETEYEFADEELSRFLECVTTDQPLLILSCHSVHHSTNKCVASAAEIAKRLQLTRSTCKRKWIIQSGEVSTLAGIREGFDWLLNSV